jgi:hypothetical protein
VDGSAGNQPDEGVSSVKSQWEKLTPVAVFVMATIGSFWFTLPYNPSSDEYKGMMHFTQFVVAVIVALIIYQTKKSSDRQADITYWGRVAAVFLFLSIVAFFGYYFLFNEWTVIHEGKVLVVGDEFKDEVQEYVKHYPNMTHWELLSNAAWIPWRIWTPESILRRRIELSLLYVVCTPLFAVTMVAVAQLMNCVMSGGKIDSQTPANH